ncbi:type IV toxin-antitoxin system AbiEi family antitoxin domain-containing protein [Nocardioides sp. SYSU DS0651]|uniref:type IV toxin-antitoxin system AbiEi family antitoxin domain-containing protein n=1 Tax=Nocardioides sp. SYSU DS0651 TaxID=3415955 RepID=UPI003F4B9B4A
MPTFDPFSGEPFTIAMAAAAGVSPAKVRYLRRAGVLRPLLHGVYVASSATDSVDLRARAAALVLPPHSVVCDRSAAWLHGISILDLGELDVVPDLEVVSRDGNDRSRRQGLQGGKRDLVDSEVMLVGDVPVTTPIRTACDVARLRGRYRAMATLDTFRRRHGLTQQSLTRMLPRFAGHRGVRQLRELIPLSTDLADSQPESWLRLMIHDDGMPMPAAQVWVDVPTWGRAKIENAYEHLRIAVEYDGEEHHTRPEDQERDDARRRALRDELDWHIIVVRKAGLAAQARDAWLRELRAVHAKRSPETPVRRIYSRGPDEPSYRRRPRRP